MQFWYKTDEHKPSDSGQYLVFQEKTGYVFVADCEHYNNGKFNFVTECDMLDGITHFAHIPPIPKECDHLWSVDLNGRHEPQCMKCMKNKTSIEQV